jgi:hypothetical protein
MIKFYTEKPSYKKQPKKETIQFLLDYSKSLKIMSTKSETYIELHLN